MSIFPIGENDIILMVMNNLLIDDCKSCMADSYYKPEYKEVPNASFAQFIVDVAK